MNQFQLFRGASWPGIPPPRVYATLGNFDGLHRGHLSILRRVVSLAHEHNAEALLISFYPHPATVVGRATIIPSLTTLRQKCSILTSIGINNLCLIHFTKSFSSESAEEFVSKRLVGSLNVGTLVLGSDARVGRGGEGDLSMIRDCLARHGREALVHEFSEEEGRKIGSREIRASLLQGDVVRSAALLGRPYAVEGKVRHGDGRGSTIGIPTANITTPRQMLPTGGVYASQVLLRGVWHNSVTNIGVRPTFGGSQLVVESHLLGYSGGAFYNHRVQISFLKKLREEIKFGSPAELVRQIRADIEAARAFHSTL